MNRGDINMLYLFGIVSLNVTLVTGSMQPQTGSPLVPINVLLSIAVLLVAARQDMRPRR